MRLDPGANPPETALAEIYNVPAPGFGVARRRHRQARASSGSRSAAAISAASTARKCKGPLNGPKATGDHCPEGWAFHQYPGPGFEGIGENSAESSYYTWVDQHNTFGLGEDVPMSTGNLNDGLIALKDGKMVVLRVPYPLGFYAKGFDGRIDDPKAGWKGRGLWTTSGDRTPWLHGRRQGHAAARRALPAAPRSAGEIDEATAGRARRVPSGCALHSSSSGRAADPRISGREWRLTGQEVLGSPRSLSSGRQTPDPMAPPEDDDEGSAAQRPALRAFLRVLVRRTPDCCGMPSTPLTPPATPPTTPPPTAPTAPPTGPAARLPTAAPFLGAAHHPLRLDGGRQDE